MLVAFIIGLSASLHCLGMCGPIAMAIPLDRSSNWKQFLGALQYNFGRIFSYTFLGFLFGTIGMSFRAFQWMQSLSLLVGLIMILIAWNQFFRFKEIRLFQLISSKISTSIGKLFRSKNTFRLPLLGLLNGFLPCGMVFMGLTNSMLQGTAIDGAKAMFFYGLGTLPMMLLVVFFAGKLLGSWRAKFRTVIPVLMTAIGLLMILRGLNLGIPYISPKVELTSTQHEQLIQKDEVSMTCCDATVGASCEAK
ncbi:MAG TPA: sulfite exporter TauE/SafE family protein [Taishania sp.]|nr:sulfite exporter TauE/SafE family protein [Taishania sp.]